VNFEIITMVKMTMLFFWVLTPCRLVGRYQRFRKKKNFRAENSSVPSEAKVVENRLSFCITAVAEQSYQVTVCVCDFQFKRTAFSIKPYFVLFEDKFMQKVASVCDAPESL
jgi:hypothetical protein